MNYEGDGVQMEKLDVKELLHIYELAKQVKCSDDFIYLIW